MYRLIPQNGTCQGISMGRHKMADTKKPVIKRAFKYDMGHYEMSNWCRRPESNRHTLRHYPLKIACLPISPRRQLTERYFTETQVNLQEILQQAVQSR